MRSKLLLKAFDNLESALYASDRRDVGLAAAELSISTVVRDATLERLRQFKNNRLLLIEANSGSIVLTTLVAGVGLYLLNKTLGETIKEGYTSSQLHRNLKEYFRRQVDEKTLYIAENVRRVFASKKQVVSVKLLPPSADEPNRIIIDISDDSRLDKGERVRSLGEEIDKLK